MTRQIQLRRGSAAENDAFTGAEGEITMDTTNNTLRVHDGTTAGGIKLAKQSEIPTIPHIPTADEIIHTTAPSSRYVNLTLQQSGAHYIMPADGYIYIRKATNAANQYIDMSVFVDNNYMYSTINCSPVGGYPCTCFLPVPSGAEVEIAYNAGAQIDQFRFIYANNN